MNTYCVYAHKRPNGNIFYIGKGLPYRPYRTDNRNKWWNRIVNKDGEYDVEIVEQDISNAEAIELEIFLISELRSHGVKLCNLTDGGDGLSGFKHSDETRRLMRITNRGKGEANRGVPLSEDHKQKLRKAKLGVKQSPSHIRNSAMARIGRIFTQETRNKISSALTGRSLSEEHKAKLQKPVRCLETGEVFESVKAACDKLGVHRQNIAKVATGRLKKTGGYRFEYVNKELTS